MTLGTAAPEGIAAVSALMTIGGVISIVAVLRQPGVYEAFLAPVGLDGSAQTGDATLSVLDRGSAALVVAAGLAVVATVGFLAIAALASGPDPGDGSTTATATPRPTTTTRSIRDTSGRDARR